MSKKFSFTLSSIIVIILFFYYLGSVNILKDDSSSFSKLQCVSYAPFSKDESPFDKNYKLSEELARKDLKLLSKYTNCIRTYSTVGLEVIPKIARENNLQMLMGAWVSSDKKSTQKELDTLIKLAKENRDVVKAVIVGNEVLLRRDISSEQLYEYIKEIKKALPDTKVTYADVWEFWLKHPQIKEVTDFVTIHILPYWEDDPMNIHKAIDHLVEVRHEVEGILGGNKDILIGETGWPSEGRMREDVLPSKINQAVFVREFVKVAEKHNWDYNIIEAFDQPWKRLSEGAVGGHWGLFDKDRNDNNVFKGEVSNFPNFKYLAFGSVLLILLFSLLLRKTEVSNSRLLTFTLLNSVFSVLYILQVEQYFITVRTNVEFVWAFLVLATHLFVYYYLLTNMANKIKAIPLYLFYLSTFFVVVSNIILAFEGRYQNFEIYAFIISSISFLWLYKNKYEEINFDKLGKILSIILVITSILTIYNETVLNIFSNIWVLISLCFAYILYKGSKNSSFKSVKDLIIYILVFIGIAFGIKFGVLTNVDLAKECTLSADSIICQIREHMGLYIHLKVFGLTALSFFVIAFLTKNKMLSILALFFSIQAIILYNIFIGSIVFVLSLYLLNKIERIQENKSKVLI